MRYHVRGPRKRNGKVGKAKGACGKVKKKVKIFGSKFPTGVYTVQFDQQKRFSAQREPARGLRGHDLPDGQARHRRRGLQRRRDLDPARLELEPPDSASRRCSASTSRTAQPLVAADAIR